MKLTFKLFLSIAIMLLFTTCKKQWRSTIVEGYARDYYSKQPIVGAKIELHAPEGSSRDFGLLQVATTDSKGHFVFEKFNALKNQNDNGRYIEIRTPENYSAYNTDGSCWYKAGKKNVLEPTLIRKVNVKFIVENFNFQGDSDKFCIHSDYSADIVDNGQIIPEQCFYGNYYRESNFKVTANVPVKYFYTVTRNYNPINHELDIIYSNDTTINLKY